MRASTARRAAPYVILALAACSDPAGERPDAAPSDAARATDSEVVPDGARDAGPGFARVCGLLVNGGAETGDLTGWTPGEDSFLVVQEEADRFPAPAEGLHAFFAGTTAAASLVQDVSVSAHAETIDAGGIVAHLSGQVRDWAIDDRAILRIESLDAAGATLGAASTAAFDGAVWTQRSISLTLPAGTRAVRAVLLGERVDGTDNDAFFDALELCLDEAPPTLEEVLEVAPLLSWVTADEVTVAWETTQSGVGRVDWGTTPALGRTVSEAAASTHHRVRLTALPGGATVYYRLVDPDVPERPGELHAFGTAPPPGAPFSFVVWGDSQSGYEVFTALAARMAEAAPDFAVAVGDLVQSPSESAYRHELLLPFALPGASVPLLSAPGNHDAVDGLALFDQHVAQPGHCFGWSFGSAFFLFLDTNEPLPGGPNEDCLAAAEASPALAAASLRIALLHEPPRIEYWLGGGTIGAAWVREVLEPRLVADGFQLALAGHSHLYTYGPADATGGLTWVTTGGGGGELEPADSQVADWPQITVVHLRHHFLRASVVGAVLTLQAIADTGEVLHEVEVVGE